MKKVTHLGGAPPYALTCKCPALKKTLFLRTHCTASLQFQPRKSMTWHFSLCRFPLCVCFVKSLVSFVVELIFHRILPTWNDVLFCSSSSSYIVRHFTHDKRTIYVTREGKSNYCSTVWKILHNIQDFLSGCGFYYIYIFLLLLLLLLYTNFYILVKFTHYSAEITSKP